MSDSEEDFASADEGEVSHSDSKQPDTTQEKDEKDNQGQETDDPSKSTKGNEGSELEKLEHANNTSAIDNDKESTESGVKDTSSLSCATGKKSGNQKKGKHKGKKKAGSQSETSVQKKSCDKTGIVNTEVDESADVSEKGFIGSEKSKEDVEKDGHGIVTSENVSAKDAGDIVDKEDDMITIAEPCNEVDEKEGENTPTKSKEVGQEKHESDSGDLLKSPSTQSITRPAPDHTEEQENVLKKLAGAGTEKKQSGWGWGWGSSLLNVASTSVSTFTSQVGEGFNTMIETVESTLNVPSPEDLVAEKKKQKEEEEEEGEEKEKIPEARDSVQGDAELEKEYISPASDKSESTESRKAENQTPQESSNSWFSSWGVGNITKMVESTGKTIVTGSLDVLETLGKKTFDALNEHDPGLKKTRGLLKEGGNKPNLSAILRDARDHHENQVKLEKESEEARKAHFGTLFDDFQGLAHLEALEILSNQSEKKVNTLLMSLSPDIMAALKPQLLEIRTNFEIGEDEEEDVDEHDFTELLSDIFGKLDIGTSPDKLTRMQGRIRDIIKEFGERENETPAKEIHQSAIQSLAEFTAKCMEQFHKAGEMVLLHKAQNSDFVACSCQLHSLTKVLCTEVGILSTKFTECLNRNAEADETTNVNQLVTSVYLEASNSSSYIQDGFQLLLPVMQQASIEKKQEPLS